MSLAISPRSSSTLARLTLIGGAALVSYAMYVTWDSPPPPPIIWPDFTDPIGQLQYVVAVMALAIAGLAGAIRRIPRYSPQAVPQMPTARIPLKNAQRFAILKRDGYRCQLCGQSARDGVRLEVDHKLAVTNGGTNDPSNLWALCQSCNNGKSDSYL